MRLYAHVSQIVNYGDDDHERLYAFGRFVLPDLRVAGDGDVVRPEAGVELERIRTQLVSSGDLGLGAGDDAAGVKAPADVGTGRPPEEERETLSELVRDVEREVRGGPDGRRRIPVHRR